MSARGGHHAFTPEAIERQRLTRHMIRTLHDLGYTYQQIADAADLGRMTIYRWARDYASIRPDPAFRRLCRAYLTLKGAAA